jgi:virulence RhuM family protein
MATAQLEQYLVKGFAMDDERLKHAGGNYFDELLARIRDIRSSRIDGVVLASPDRRSARRCRSRSIGPPSWISSLSRFPPGRRSLAPRDCLYNVAHLFLRLEPPATHHKPRIAATPFRTKHKPHGTPRIPFTVVVVLCRVPK